MDMNTVILVGNDNKKECVDELRKLGIRKDFEIHREDGWVISITGNFESWIKSWAATKNIKILEPIVRV